MFKSFVSLLLILLLTATMASAAMTGDPFDSNDGIVDSNAFAESGCAMAIEYPNCVPCWTRCIFAMMADADQEEAGGWGW
jgi:hypothetical protein